MKIGKEWKGIEEGVASLQRTYLPLKLISQLINGFTTIVFLTQNREKTPPNMKMIFGGIVGTAIQDMIVHKLTVKEVMKGKK